MMEDYEVSIVEAISKVFPEFSSYDLKDVKLSWEVPTERIYGLNGEWDIQQTEQTRYSLDYKDCTWQSVDTGQTWLLISHSKEIDYMKPGNPKQLNEKYLDYMSYGNNNDLNTLSNDVSGFYPNPTVIPALGSTTAYNIIKYPEVSIQELREQLKAELRAEVLAEENAKKEVLDKFVTSETSKRKINIDEI